MDPPSNEKDTRQNPNKEQSPSVGLQQDSMDSITTLKRELSEFMIREDSFISSREYPGAERSEYDYNAERHNPFATNLLEATSQLTKGSLGVGILSMHQAFMDGGLVASTIGFFLVALLISNSMGMLVSSAQKLYLMIRVSRLSYPDLAEAALATGPAKKLRRFSKVFRYTIEFLIFLEMFGTCSLYEIMIAKTIKKELEFLFESVAEMELTLRAYIFIMMIPLAFLCLIRKWKYLAPLSIIADLFMAICIITTMAYSLIEANDISERSLWKSLPGLFKFFGVCLYSMDGVPVVLPVENNMRNPEHIQFVLRCGMSLVSLGIFLTGFLGYWGWGESCRSPITLHMPFETVPIILQFLLAATLMVTFAIQFWVPFRIIWRYLGKNQDLGKKHHCERLYRMLLLVLITCLSTIVPNPHDLMILLGVFFISFNSLIFPAFIDTLVMWHDHLPGKTKWLLLKNISIAFTGLILCVGGIYSYYVI